MKIDFAASLVQKCEDQLCIHWLRNWLQANIGTKPTLVPPLTAAQALLRTEGVQLSFTDEAVREIARVAEEVNLDVENIGARRLHTVMERITEQVGVSGRAVLLRELVFATLPRCLRVYGVFAMDGAFEMSDSGGG